MTLIRSAFLLLILTAGCSTSADIPETSRNHPAHPNAEIPPAREVGEELTVDDPVDPVPHEMKKKDTEGMEEHGLNHGMEQKESSKNQSDSKKEE
jgi:hypothetical protein